MSNALRVAGQLLSDDLGSQFPIDFSPPPGTAATGTFPSREVITSEPGPGANPVHLSHGMDTVEKGFVISIWTGFAFSCGRRPMT